MRQTNTCELCVTLFPKLKQKSETLNKHKTLAFFHKACNHVYDRNGTSVSHTPRIFTEPEATL